MVGRVRRLGLVAPDLEQGARDGHDQHPHDELHHGVEGEEGRAERDVALGKRIWEFAPQRYPDVSLIILNYPTLSVIARTFGISF